MIPDSAEVGRISRAGVGRNESGEALPLYFLAKDNN